MATTPVPVINTTHAFNLPSPYQAEMAKIADQRRMAEMLQAQSQAPTERFSYKGIEARTPVTAGLAKALQGFGGAYFQKQAREEEKALGERYRAEQMGDMSELIRGLNAPAVAGSAAIPEQLAGRPFIPADEEGNPMPDVSAAPAIPAVVARAAGQIDPSMMGRMKTQEGANQVLALVMAQRQAQIDAERRANEPYNLTGDQTRFQPMGAGMPPMVVASGVRKDDYGTTPTIVKDSLSPTGFSGFVMNSRGEKKNIGPIDPVNQYTMGTVDAALKRDMDMYRFGNLSAEQLAALGIKLMQAGVDVTRLNWETGQGPTPQPILPPNAPAPNVGGQTRPGMQVPAPVQGVRDADRIRILQEELARNPNDIALRQELAKAQSGVNYAGAGAGRTSVAPTSGAPVAAPVAAPVGGVAPPALTGKTQQALAQEAALKAQENARELPKVIDTANQAIKNIDDMIGDLGREVPKGQVPKNPHPGFKDLIGRTWKPGARFIPGTNAADLDARLDQVKGGAFLQAFEALKGGGQITQIEGEKATAAISRMSRSQSENEFVTAAREYQKIMRDAVDRARMKSGGASGGASGDQPPSNSVSGKIRVVDF